MKFFPAPAPAAAFADSVALSSSGELDASDLAVEAFAGARVVEPLLAELLFRLFKTPRRLRVVVCADRFHAAVAH